MRGDGEKDPTEGDDSLIDAAEVKILQGIINLGAQEQTPTLHSWVRNGDPVILMVPSVPIRPLRTWMLRDTRPKRKGSTPVKVTSNTGQWTEEDLNVVCQLCYKTDLEHFQKY